MFQPPLPQLPPEDDFLTEGVLRSFRFSDIYFSIENGLEEARHVFIRGTGFELPILKTRYGSQLEDGSGSDGLKFSLGVAGL